MQQLTSPYIIYLFFVYVTMTIASAMAKFAASYIVRVATHKIVSMPSQQ